MATSVQDFLKQNPNYVGYANTANRAKPKEAPKSKKGSGKLGKTGLSAWISELGGAGAAALATPAALAAAPFTFGASLLAIPAAGFAGGFGGRAVENKLRDDEYRVGDAAKEGLLSGALSAGGVALRGGRGLYAAGKAANTGVKGMGALKAGTQVIGSAGDKAAKSAASKAIIGGGKKGATAFVNNGADDLVKTAKLTAGRNTLERGGNSMYRSTLGVDDIVMPNNTKPTTIFKQDELVDAARRYGIKGNPVQMQRQAGVVYNRVNTDVAKELAKSKGTVSYSKLYKSAVDDVAKALPLRVESTIVKDEIARTLQNTLGPLVKNGKVNATAVNAFKTSLPVDSAFKKLAIGGNLTAKESADLALWSYADDLIAGNAEKGIKGLAPSAKALTKEQSNLYGISQGLGRMTRTPGDPSSVVDVVARIASPTIRKGQNALGRGMMAAGQTQAGLSGAMQKAAPIAKGALARGIGNQLMAPMPEETSDAGMTEVDGGVLTPDALYGAGAMGGMEQGMGVQEQAPQSAYSLEQAIADIQAAPNAKAQKAIMDYYEFISKAEASQNKGQELTAIQRNKIAGYQTANEVVDQLEQLWQGVNQSDSQLVAGLTGLPGIKQTRSMVDSDTRQYTQFAEGTLAPIIKSLGETGVLTDKDIIRAYGLVPNLQDSSGVARNKIAQLRMLLSNAQSATSSGAETQEYGTDELYQAILGAQ